MLENPKAIGYTGGMVSAPIFKAITQRLVNNYGVLSQTRTASLNPQQDAPAIVVPDVKNLKKDVAQEMLREKGITANILGAGDVIVRQAPDAGATVRPGGVVQLFTQSDPSAVFGSALQVPDLRGMSVRRAITRLAAEQLDASVKGSGVVTSQYPEAGAPVKKNSRIILMCEHLH
jgi:beta-lactam-binding protein with PASTA domain